MEYRLVFPAVEKILAEATTSPQGDFGWTNPTSNLSRTVTAQIIITLSKCSEFEKNDQRRQKILGSIDKGFQYLKSSLQTGNSELVTFAFTLIAHLEHHERYPDKHPFDIDLIKTCLGEIRSTDFYYEREKAYQYSNSIDRKYFPTYLVLQTFLRLLSFLEKNPSVKLDNLSKEDLLNEIDNCFKYIFSKLLKKINDIHNIPFIKNAEYLSLGVQILKYYEEYSNTYNRIPNITNPQYNIEIAVDYFTENLEQVFTNWHIQIDRTPFDLIYISNLISGLIRSRQDLSEKGLDLLYRLALFITTDERMQEKDHEGNIVFTKIPNAPVWGTAHSLNAILKLTWCINELKWVNSKPQTVEIEKIVEKEVEKEIHSIGREAVIHISKTISGRIILPILLSALSTLLMYKFLLNELTITNAFLVQALLIAASIIAYFLPQFLFYMLLKSKAQFEKHEIWFKFTYIILAIVAYLIMISYYTTSH